MEELAPELLPMLVSLSMPANFVPVTNAVLKEMARRGITREDILSTLHRLARELPGDCLVSAAAVLDMLA